MRLPRFPLASTAAIVLAVLVSAAPAHAADIFKGKEIYEKYCASCHGNAGESVMPGTRNFARQGLMQPDQVLFQTIRSGKNAMPGYRGILSERDILDVVAYLRTFH